MTYTSFKFIPKCNIPRDVVPVNASDVPKVVKENITDIEKCSVYLTIACWDGSWMYTAFNRETHTASRVSLFDVTH
jgi:hypothetical protein